MNELEEGRLHMIIDEMSIYINTFLSLIELLI